MTAPGLETQAICINDRKTFGTPFSPGSKYRGWVLLDSPTGAGTLTYRPHFADQRLNPGITIAIPVNGSASASAEPAVRENTDDYQQMKANIARHGGQPFNSAESQYLFACQQGTLPKEACP